MNARRSRNSGRGSTRSKRLLRRHARRHCSQTDRGRTEGPRGVRPDGDERAPLREGYGESCRESLARELTEELATAITAADGCLPTVSIRPSTHDGRCSGLSRPNWQQSRMPRIASRGSSGTSSRSWAQPLDRAGFHVLVSSRDRLDALEDHLTAILEERQTRIRREHSVSAVGMTTRPGTSMAPVEQPTRSSPPSRPSVPTLRRAVG